MTEVKIFAIFGHIYCEFQNIYIRNIRKHIRLCVRAALQLHICTIIVSICV